MYSTFPRFSVEKQNAQAEQSALGAELASATKSPPRRGLGVGRVVNAVAHRKKKSPTQIRDSNSFPRFSVEKQDAQAEQSTLGAEFNSATKSPPRRGLGVGRVVNAVAHRKKKSPTQIRDLTLLVCTNHYLNEIISSTPYSL